MQSSFPLIKQRWQHWGKDFKEKNKKKFEKNFHHWG